MTTKEKIEKKGYKIKFVVGSENGVYKTVSIHAEKNGQFIAKGNNITGLARKLTIIK